MSATRLPRETERRIADGLRDALERYEQAHREALARLREDMQRALFGVEEPRSNGKEAPHA